MDPLAVLGLPRGSHTVETFLADLSKPDDAPSVDSSTVAGSSYDAYASLGLSLEYQGRSYEDQRLVAVHVDNPSRNEDEKLEGEAPGGQGRRPEKKALEPYTRFPILLPSKSAAAADERGKTLQLNEKTTGKDLVEFFGEPDRKGGGTQGLGIWTEWVLPRPRHLLSDDVSSSGSDVGLFVQWRGAAAIGPGAWERGKHRIWGTLLVWWEP